MNNRMPLRLEFQTGVPCQVQARISYAFRVFAAIYGYEVADQDEAKPSLCCFYGVEQEYRDRPRCVHIPARYVLRRPEVAPPKPVTCFHGKEQFHLFHGRDETSGNPDWLGEIFEWLSSADEMSISARDSIGRIDYNQSVFCRHSISPQKPYASQLMAWLQESITEGKGSETLPCAPSPIPGINHLVICSHDIDFYFAGRCGSLRRVLTNIGIAIFVTHNLHFLRDNLYQLFELARGREVGNFLPRLLRASQELDFASTFFVIASRECRRDANYKLERVARYFQEIVKNGSSIALHGSYRSVVEKSDLSSEAAVLESGIGFRPTGSRQHWLRFDRHTRLFANIASAGFLYDSSLGYSDRVGFRNGASFAFPPYNFEQEKPYDFLVIPLTIMDRALEIVGRDDSEQGAKAAASVLKESRRWGWGGIAVLWHNPIEPLSVPTHINRIFWQQINTKAKYHERWISAEEFLRFSLARYQRAGLLRKMHPIAPPGEIPGAPYDPVHETAMPISAAL